MGYHVFLAEVLRTAASFSPPTVAFTSDWILQRQRVPVLERLTTEQHNPASENVDQLSSIGIVELINREDQGVANAVAKVSVRIAEAVDTIVAGVRKGGRLIYVGAGTSGRLGVLDASECPPTFNTSPELVVGVIAGGHPALVRSIEGAEDDPEQGEHDLREIDLHSNDTVVGIATSGRTPYVLGGLAYAQKLGCKTIGLSCNPDSSLEQVANFTICPIVGPEIISGSTRMKAGTATKMVLNMLTTATMIRLGKTYGNLMVDLRATNSKLKHRSRRIVAMLADVSDEEAQRLLDECDGEVKTAIVSRHRHVVAKEARQILDNVGGHLRAAIGNT